MFFAGLGYELMLVYITARSDIPRKYLEHINPYFQDSQKLAIATLSVYIQSFIRGGIFCFGILYDQKEEKTPQMESSSYKQAIIIFY